MVKIGLPNAVEGFGGTVNLPMGVLGAKPPKIVKLLLQMVAKHTQNCSIFKPSLSASAHLNYNGQKDKNILMGLYSRAYAEQNWIRRSGKTDMDKGIFRRSTTHTEKFSLDF